MPDSSGEHARHLGLEDLAGRNNFVVSRDGRRFLLLT
jgi:hypothetical protein